MLGRGVLQSGLGKGNGRVTYEAPVEFLQPRLTVKAVVDHRHEAAADQARDPQVIERVAKDADAVAVAADTVVGRAHAETDRRAEEEAA